MSDMSDALVFEMVMQAAEFGSGQAQQPAQHEYRDEQGRHGHIDECHKVARGGGDIQVRHVETADQDPNDDRGRDPVQEDLLPAIFLHLHR